MSLSGLSSILNTELDSLDAGSVCFHTDITSLGFPRPQIYENKPGKREILEGYTQVLFEIGRSRSLLFPTFNYDYFRTRVYDVEKDRCQVGVLNEYFRTLPGIKRTQTPVFNFSILPSPSQADTFSFTPQAVPFSERSTFAEMCRAQTWVVLLGAPLARSTLIHYCEYVARVGFRYQKHFPGKIVLGQDAMPVDFSFRVRVIHPQMPTTFDWRRIETDMLQAGVLKALPYGGNKIYLYRADTAFHYWMNILTQDELGLYTPEGKRSVQQLYDMLGYPLTLKMFEEV